ASSRASTRSIPSPAHARPPRRSGHRAVQSSPSSRARDHLATFSRLVGVMAQRDKKVEEPTEVHLHAAEITLCANSCGFPGNPATKNPLPQLPEARGPDGVPLPVRRDVLRRAPVLGPARLQLRLQVGGQGRHRQGEPRRARRQDRSVLTNKTPRAPTRTGEI
uniref:Uncharacterized protein n=1 Tax=Aegilops tauschii subsp. strangulata TaxID=200361 RepID=A0A453RJA1_AEGTS